MPVPDPTDGSPSGPGLDVAALRGMLAARRLETGHLPGRVREHLEQHDGYVALSGGKDSMAVLHLAVQADPAVPVCFFDSGLEYPETLDYIERIADTWNLNLTWIKARPSALEILHAHGSWQHGRAPAADDDMPDLHTALITEPARKAHAEHGEGELWGVRSKESQGRRIAFIRALGDEIARECQGCCPPAEPGSRESMQQRSRHGGVIRRKDATVAYSPVWDWTDADVWGYLHHHGVPANPVYAKLRRLGVPARLQRVSLMLEATNIQYGRAVWLRRGWPRIYQELAQVLPRLTELT
ncbi:hypothetical protein GCM10012280_61130 [Wenjunlia tyrosinilytica]|uniref:Phosphoadenosine phosphosulphate reductase domain-containing protein n=2 Tax=Wenjunlia tyrosinilytica TaxID=1544741 RepID=A0A917ZVS1_9ACTN|nr:hypothetical protein GCM10012280_61130 [Wenjunlia tyrosinilytica]